jgi:hypothetical protein
MRVQQGPHAGVPDSQYTHYLLSWKDSFRSSLNAAATPRSSTPVVTLTMALWPGRSSSRAAASPVALAEAFPALSFASGLPAPITCALRQILRRRIFPRASSLGERAKRASFALALARHLVFTEFVSARRLAVARALPSCGQPQGCPSGRAAREAATPLPRSGVERLSGTVTSHRGSSAV